MTDDLLKSIDKLSASIKYEATNAQKTYDQSTVGKFVADKTMLGKFWYQFYRSMIWVYATFIRPVTSRVISLGLWTFGKYRKLWNKVVYKKDKYGTPEFSKVRGGLMLIASFVFAVYVLPIITGLIWNTTLYTLTAERNEHLYLNNSLEIDPAHDIHSVKGCLSEECNDQDSINFRVRPSFFNHVWSFLHHHVIFYPDYVAGAVPNVVSYCTVTTYGFRFKLVTHQFDIYPDLLEVKSCKPLTYEGQKPKG